LAVPADDPHPETARVSAQDVDHSRLILLEQGHCLRDQALAFCAPEKLDMQLSLGAASLATIMQMVANGYAVTLLPEVAIDAEVRDERIKLLRFVAPEPSRTIGLAFRRTSPRKQDFVALGRFVVEAMAGDRPRPGASDDQFARGLKPTRRPPPGSHKNRVAPSPTPHAGVTHKAAKPKEEGLPDHGPQGDALVADARRRADS